jgi:hypothetical protein
MKSFIQYINEIFDKPYPVKMDKTTSPLSGKTYMITYKFKSANGSRYEVDLTFVPILNNMVVNLARLDGLKGVFQAGGGDALKVYATTIECMKRGLVEMEEARGEKIGSITFQSPLGGGASIDDRRRNTYLRMVKRFSKEMGFKFSYSVNNSPKHGEYYSFRLDRKGM